MSNFSLCKECFLEWGISTIAFSPLNQGILTDSYFSKRKEGVDNNKTLILRDYKNKILYSAMHTNTAINEVLYPLIGM